MLAHKLVHKYLFAELFTKLWKKVIFVTRPTQPQQQTQNTSNEQVRHRNAGVSILELGGHTHVAMVFGLASSPMTARLFWKRHARLTCYFALRQSDQSTQYLSSLTDSLTTRLTTGHSLQQPVGYLEGLGSYGHGGLEHAVGDAQQVGVLEEGGDQSHVLGPTPRLQQTQGPSLRIPAHVVQDHVKPGEMEPAGEQRERLGPGKEREREERRTYAKLYTVCSDTSLNAPLNFPFQARTSFFVFVCVIHYLQSPPDTVCCSHGLKQSNWIHWPKNMCLYMYIVTNTPLRLYLCDRKHGQPYI